MISPARVAAVRTLRDVHARGRLLPDALAAGTRSVDDERDRALAAEIATGALRFRQALDHVVARAARRDVDDIDADVLDVLRAGVYQLMHLDRVPPSAIVNDSVELARRAGKASAAGFVNAVLRRVATNPSVRELPARPPVSVEESRLAPGATEDRERVLDYLSVTLSHPRWLVERWLDRVGFAAAERWCRFNNGHAPLTLRANTLKTGRDDLAAALAAVNVHTRPTRYAPDGLEVLSGHPLRTPLAAEGAFLVQDEASQLVATVAGVQPGWRVLDACASPGGKTVAFAGAMRGAGVLVATDLRARRVRLLSRTLRRAGAHRVHVVQANLEQGVPFPAGSFDCVVVDAPCSGLGTIRRDPDIRWRRRPEELGAFASRQLRLLAHSARTLRRGGQLVYATCSSEPEENEDVIARFLSGHRAFAVADLRSANIGRMPDAVLDEHGFLRTLPFAHDLEAFFAAVLRPG